jgi:hypothetical protein
MTAATTTTTTTRLQCVRLTLVVEADHSLRGDFRIRSHEIVVEDFRIRSCELAVVGDDSRSDSGLLDHQRRGRPWQDSWQIEEQGERGVLAGDKTLRVVLRRGASRWNGS